MFVLRDAEGRVCVGIFLGSVIPLFFNRVSKGVTLILDQPQIVGIEAPFFAVLHCIALRCFSPSFLLHHEIRSRLASLLDFPASSDIGVQYLRPLIATTIT
jgi:hypothetical protein